PVRVGGWHQGVPEVGSKGGARRGGGRGAGGDEGGRQDATGGRAKAGDDTADVAHGHRHYLGNERRDGILLVTKSRVQTMIPAFPAAAHAGVLSRARPVTLFGDKVYCQKE